MSDDIPDVPDGKFAQLRHSITNLWDEFGSTDSLVIGVLLNLGMLCIGLFFYLEFSGVLEFAGAVWAILHAIAIVVGVMRA